jgi:hypothetical protein
MAAGGGSLNAGANQAFRKPAWSITGDRLTIHQRLKFCQRRLEQFRRSLVLQKGSVAMDDKSGRKELERRLEQAKRMAAFAGDTVTNERLQKLVQDLEQQLRKSE